LVRLCFVDLMPWDYDADTPYERPLGGMQSAACHLTAALAATLNGATLNGEGHEIALATHTTRPAQRRGVACLSLGDPATLARLRETPWDAVVSLTAIPSSVRAVVRPGTPAFLWTGHAEDQPAVACLSDPVQRDGWDAIVLVSDWQRSRYVERFGLPAERTIVLRNAIAPAFENLFPDRESLARAKQADPPQLAYTSTPFRGLEFLVGMFPMLDRSARLRVFSGMTTYLPGGDDRQLAALEAQYASLYELCRTTPGIEHVGAIPQPALAEALRAVAVLAYPSIFAETGCIAVLEAMAAGCAVVTTDLGALAETTAGRAILIEPGEDWSSYCARYLMALDLAIPFARSPAGLDHLWKQVCFVNATGTWKVRAAEWLDMLDSRAV